MLIWVLILIVIFFAAATFYARKEIAKLNRKLSLIEVIDINLSSLMFKANEPNIGEINISLLGYLNWARLLLLLLFWFVN